MAVLSDKGFELYVSSTKKICFPFNFTFEISPLPLGILKFKKISFLSFLMSVSELIEANVARILYK